MRARAREAVNGQMLVRERRRRKKIENSSSSLEERERKNL